MGRKRPRRIDKKSNRNSNKTKRQRVVSVRKTPNVAIQSVTKENHDTIEENTNDNSNDNTEYEYKHTYIPENIIPNSEIERDECLKRFLFYHNEAEKGDAAACSNVGICYENGIGVARDLKKAVKWYIIAADNGDNVAQNNLGMCLERGRGIKKNIKEALRMYCLSAEGGNIRAKFNIQRCNEEGIGVDNFDNTVSYCNEHADNQDCEEIVKHEKTTPIKTPIKTSIRTPIKTPIKTSIRTPIKTPTKYSSVSFSDEYKSMSMPEIISSNSSHLYSEFLRLCKESDLDQAEKILIELSKTRCPKYKLTAVILLSIRPKYNKDVIILADKYKNPFAIHTVGYYYARGIGVIKNINHAEKLFEVSSNSGVVSAMNSLAVSLLRRNIDIKRALHLLEIASSKGNMYATYNLALYWIQSSDVLSDKHFNMMMSVANANIPEAQCYIARWYAEGNEFLKQDIDEAARLWRVSAQRGIPNSLWVLAMRHEMKKDMKRAADYFKLVCDHQKIVFNEDIDYRLSKGSKAAEIDIPTSSKDLSKTGCFPLSSCLKWSKTDNRTYYDVANEYYNTGEYVKAIDNYKKYCNTINCPVTYIL